MAKKKKMGIGRGKRKEAIARAYAKAGKGRVRINGFLLSSFPNEVVRSYIGELLAFLGKKAEKLDIDVNVAGGGWSGQMQASATAIARAVVDYYGDEKLEQELYSYNPYWILEDPRRVEPKKYRRRKARARYQKSYR